MLPVGTLRTVDIHRVVLAVALIFTLLVLNFQLALPEVYNKKPPNEQHKTSFR